MKRIVLIAPLALVVACSQSEPTPEPTETATAAAETAALAVDGQPLAGTYDVASSDGRKMTYVVAADGTYTSTEGETTVKGTWTSSGPGNWCETAEGAAEATCYTETMSPEGVWTSANPAEPTVTSTIKRTS